MYDVNFTSAGGTILHTYTNTFMSDYSLNYNLMADSHTSMQGFFPIKVSKTPGQTYTVNVPNICMNDDQVNGNVTNNYKGTFYGKGYVIQSGSVAGLTLVTTSDISS